MIIKFITHADISGGSKAFSGVCVVFVCVCVFVRIIHVKPKRLKLQSQKVGSGIVHHESSPIPINTGSKSRSQGHKVQKHVECDRVAGVNLHLYRVLAVYS